MYPTTEGKACYDCEGCKRINAQKKLFQEKAEIAAKRKQLEAERKALQFEKLEQERINLEEELRLLDAKAKHTEQVIYIEKLKQAANDTRKSLSTPNTEMWPKAFEQSHKQDIARREEQLKREKSEMDDLRRKRDALLRRISKSRTTVENDLYEDQGINPMSYTEYDEETGQIKEESLDSYQVEKMLKNNDCNSDEQNRVWKKIGRGANKRYLRSAVRTAIDLYA